MKKWWITGDTYDIQDSIKRAFRGTWFDKARKGWVIEKDSPKSILQFLEGFPRQHLTVLDEDGKPISLSKY
jgi:hypothetical protein